MLPDRVSNPGPLTYESGVIPIALRGPGAKIRTVTPSNVFTDMPIVMFSLIDGTLIIFVKIDAYTFINIDNI